MSEGTASTRVLRTSELSVSEIAAAVVQALSEGKLVALPTDTVYGIAVNASSPPAVRRQRITRCQCLSLTRNR